MPPDLCAASGLTPDQLDDVLRLSHASRAFSGPELILFVGAVNKHRFFGKAVLDDVVGLFSADPRCPKTRLQIRKFARCTEKKAGAAWLQLLLNRKKAPAKVPFGPQFQTGLASAKT